MYISCELGHYAMHKDLYLSAGIGSTKLLHYQGLIVCLFTLWQGWFSDLKLHHLEY